MPDLTERELLLAVAAYCGMVIEENDGHSGLAFAHGWRGDSKKAAEADRLAQSVGHGDRSELASYCEAALAKWRASREGK